MEVRQYQERGRTYREYRAKVPTFVRPQIVTEFIDRFGERMYADIEGKVYIADRFDALWHRPRGTVLPRGTKDPITYVDFL